MDKTASTATYTFGGSAVVFGLTVNEFAAAVGASVAVLTFFANLWFKHQHLQLARKKADKGCDACAAEAGNDGDE